MTDMLLDEIKKEGGYALLSVFRHAGFASCRPDAGEGAHGIDLGLDGDDLHFSTFNAAGISLCIDGREGRSSAA